MELKHGKIVNRELKQAEMLLFGPLGNEQGQINGHYFAQELIYLANNYDTVKVRLNCDGGLISHGLSIFSAMMGAPAHIHLHIEGIAASMGAIFVAAADRVTMNDFARLMLHSPYYVNEDNEAVTKLSAKDKKALAVLRLQLVEMLAKRGIETSEVERMLTTTDLWLTADKAAAAKLVDEVIITGRKRELMALDHTAIAAMLTKETFNPNNHKMNNLIAKLKLPATADEAAIMAAVDQLETSHNNAVAALNAVNKKLVDKLIAVAKGAGVITDATEAGFQRLATQDPGLFADFVNIDPAALKGNTNPRLSEFIAQLSALRQDQQAAAGADTRDWDWYQKNNPQALAQMESTDKAKFDKLKAEYEAKFV
ncbi:MAG: ATP-dependent Clp protease proteolytic subunit [Bacteroidales bacterium]|nr:ATP-dependent Clp protease proteolytic subunit [Bacteroidales bacterium]